MCSDPECSKDRPQDAFGLSASASSTPDRRSSLIRSNRSCLYAQYDCLQHSHSLCLPFPLLTNALKEIFVSTKRCAKRHLNVAIAKWYDILQQPQMQAPASCAFCFLCIASQINALRHVEFPRRVPKYLTTYVPGT